MNKLTFLMKERTLFSRLSYRYISKFSLETSFHQRYKQNSLLPLNQKQSSLLLSYERHASFITRIKEKLKNSISAKTKVRIAGCIIYEKIVDDIDCESFLKYFKLEDTFQSWFLINQLHMWMIILLTVSEKNGREFRNSLTDSMWNDVELRIDKIVKMRSSQKKKYLKELVGQFQSALVAYDEGILCDDTVLAAAAWRSLFYCQNVDPELLESIVIYIRRQIAHLESYSIEKIIFGASVSFLPLHTILSENRE